MQGKSKELEIFPHKKLSPMRHLFSGQTSC